MWRMENFDRRIVGNPKKNQPDDQEKKLGENHVEIVG